MDADPVELRVLGCLIEKQRTTPDAYPLSLNALRIACNQSTNRDPVVEYDEPQIRDALERLSRRGWVRLASGAGSRAVKYRHLFDEALSLDDAEVQPARGAHAARRADTGGAEGAERAAAPVGSLAEVEATLRGLDRSASSSPGWSGGRGRRRCA